MVTIKELINIIDINNNVKEISALISNSIITPSHLQILYTISCFTHSGDSISPVCSPFS